MTRTQFSLRFLALSTLAMYALGCSSGSSKPGAGGGGAGASSEDGDAGPSTTGGTPDAAPALPFQAETPSVYLAKVKNLLVGLPPTDDEVKAVTADPTQLKPLVQQWMKLPQYTQKMARFFELAFQQTQISDVDFEDQVYPKRLAINSATTPLLVENAQQSFARTMLALASTDQPFTQSTTTKTFMMTTALKETYAFFDAWQVDNAGKVTDRVKDANPKAQLVIEAAQGPIPIAETLDPMSPNYMHWYNPDVANSGKGIVGCGTDPVVMPLNSGALHYLIFGSVDGYKTAAGVSCPPYGDNVITASQLTASDFTDWTMVTVRAPKTGEAPTTFYDLPSLRTAKELVLAVPRTGFFSTPAFFANWQTNISNQMRVTMNQTLIVALGAQVDGSDPTMTPGNPVPGLDATHATAPCIGCHQTLDPLRSVFSSNYSWNYHNQTDSTWSAQPGLFSFQNVIKPVTTMDDLGATLAQHPLFESAWVQKLCYYANSAPCSADDPEFTRIVALFKSSNDSWNTLVAEIFSSPLITDASQTKTATDNGEVIAVSRRDHLCAALNARLGFVDVCGLSVVTRAAQKNAIPQIVSGMPSDGYGRGSTIPVLPNQPTLFYRAALENICEIVAAQVIDVAAAKQVAGVKAWSSTAPAAAIADFVSIVMGLPPSDARAAQAATILNDNFTAAMGQKATASDALKSTFVAACLSPSATSIGM